MKGLTAVYSVAPRVLSLLALSSLVVAGAIFSQPELLMRTALVPPHAVGPIHHDEIVDPPDLEVSKLLAAHRDGDALQPQVFLPAGLYGQVSSGDRIPVALPNNKLGLMDVGDVRELGKLIIPGTGEREPKSYLLLIGRIVGDSDGELVRLVVDASARPPFGALAADDRRSL